METYDFSKANITFFAAGGKISEKYAEKAAEHTIVIDNSSFFRMDPDVPLIVPQVNGSEVKKMKKNIIANPNCSTAQLVLVLKPLHDLFKIKRVIVSTYQSYSWGSKGESRVIDEGYKVEYKDILENIINRDSKDTKRKDSPLIISKDAVVIDNSELTISNQLDIIIKLIDSKL